MFFWKGSWWLVTDFWKGLGVYRSDDGLAWDRRQDILSRPGKRADDGALGHHADVLVQGERAFIFYFTHPEEQTAEGGYRQRRTSIQVAELELSGGELICDRDKPFELSLAPGGF